MVKQKRFFRTLGLLFAFVFMAISGVAGAAAVSSVPQTYANTGEVLHNGSIVRLKDREAKEVIALDEAHARDMLGVVTAANDAPVSLASPSDQRQVYVATTGQYNVLVTNQEGAIKTGDFITISAIHGIGMRATEDNEIVIGKALAAFDGKTSVDGRATVKAVNGDERTVAVGHILVDISIAHNPFYKNNKTDGVPSFLAKAASVVSDQPVGALRIYAGLAVIIVCIMTAGFVIYAGVRNGMVAVGRNPLAKSSIMRSLIQVLIISLIIFIIGIIAVYLLLRL